VTAGGQTLIGVISDATTDTVTIETTSGVKTMSTAAFESAIVGGYEYLKPDWGQKIFYFHVPVAEISFIAFGVAAFFAIRFLMTRKREYDTKNRIAMETTLMFVLMTMATGILWTRAAWGVWWEWEPRLTTYFIMTLLVVAYFVLRNSVEDEERRAVYASVFSILGFIDAPISFFITRLLPSTHPVIEKGGLEPPMLVSFIVAQIGMLFIGYAIYRLRMGEVELADRLEQAKARLEG
jgi:heme exporter protein C